MTASWWNVVSCLRVMQGTSYENMTIIVQNYVESLISKYPYWNRTLGADHFFVTCHDVGVRATEGLELLVKNSIRAVCSPSYDVGFIPHKDVALPQVLQPFALPAGGNDIENRWVFLLNFHPNRWQLGFGDNLSSCFWSVFQSFYGHLMRVMEITWYFSAWINTSITNLFMTHKSLVSTIFYSFSSVSGNLGYVTYKLWILISCILVRSTHCLQRAKDMVNVSDLSDL